MIVNTHHNKLQSAIYQFVARNLVAREMIMIIHLNDAILNKMLRLNKLQYLIFINTLNDTPSKDIETPSEDFPIFYHKSLINEENKIENKILQEKGYQE